MLNYLKTKARKDCEFAMTPRHKTDPWNLKLEALATAYAEHPLLAELNAIVARYKKLELRLNKIARISDKFQHDLIQLNQSLENMALTDALTGLLNRHAMNKCLQAEFNRMQREALPFGLLMLDVDHFKYVNDTFGHAVGDQVLVEVAQQIKGMTRSYDACCRWGGEEFLVLLPNADRQGMASVDQKLRLALLNHPVILDDGQRVDVTFSAGAHLALAGETLDESIKQADDALYQAKRQGRNCLIWSLAQRSELNEAAQ
jgi:diguanylate cyclase (GGDEF)-like protein